MSAETSPSRAERLFHICLPAIVEGPDAAGLKFQERTEVSSINAQVVYFSLKAKVLIGTRLKLQLSIPASLLLGSPLNLYLRGRVTRVQAQPGPKTQAVIIRLDKKHLFLAGRLR